MDARMWKQILTALGVAVALQLPAHAADDGTIDYAGKDPTEDELIDALMPRTNLRTRGLSPSAVNATGAAVAPSAMPQPKLSFDITFELNSDRITPKAETTLAKLGRVMTSEDLTDVQFVIEGHTDVTGTLQYNMRLSQRRAEAVKRFLIERFDLDPTRLKTVGKGPTDLLDKNNPASGRNRRVVFLSAEQVTQ